MPIYEYVCPDCERPFEKLVRGGRKVRERPMPCPTCGQESHRKKVTLVAAVGASDSTALAAACAPSG